MKNGVACRYRICEMDCLPSGLEGDTKGNSGGAEEGDEGLVDADGCGSGTRLCSGGGGRARGGDRERGKGFRLARSGGGHAIGGLVDALCEETDRVSCVCASEGWRDVCDVRERCK